MADYALTNRYACVDERGQGKKNKLTRHLFDASMERSDGIKLWTHTYISGSTYI